MKIDMSPMLKGETDKISVDYPLTIKDAFYGVTFNGPFHVYGTITNLAGYIILKLNVEADYTTQCDRCLTLINGKFRTEFTKAVAPQGQLQDEENEEYVILSGTMLDVDEQLEDEITVTFPSKHICKEDCLGLCDRCGKNLNEGGCGCVKKDINPIWDKIKKQLDE